MSQVFDRGFKTWCEKVSEDFRADLELKTSDPLDAWAFAEHLGIFVWTPEEVPGLDGGALTQLVKTDSSSWSAVTICQNSHELIIVNSQHSRARQSSNLMHEMSHLIIGHSPARVDVDETGLLMLSSFDKKQEEEANWLAGTLLLPRSALMLILNTQMEDRAAAAHYNTSLDMLRFRKNVTGVLRQMQHRKSYSARRAKAK